LKTARPFDVVTGGLEYNGGAGADVKTINLAQIRAMTYILKDTEIFNCFLFTGSEYFANSGFTCIQADTNITAFIPVDGSLTVGPADATGELLVANYGSIWNFWMYDADASSGALNAQTVSHMMVVGTKGGQGVIGRQILTLSGTAGSTRIVTPDHEATGASTITGPSVSGINTLDAQTDFSIEYLLPPVTGVAQFRGLTAGTTESYYLQVICLGVAPAYTTWQQNIAGASWILNCYTGIPQCAVRLADGVTPLNTTIGGTTVATCMADPRYLTWRSFVVQITNAGTVTWFRLDSYWNKAAK